jgi:ribosomal-protein-serine acetyltransferase
VLRLPRLEIRCEPENPRSIAVAERCGFVREGLLRHAAVISGRPRDAVLYARIAPERSSPALR